MFCSKIAFKGTISYYIIILIAYIKINKHNNSSDNNNDNTNKYEPTPP